MKKNHNSQKLVITGSIFIIIIIIIIAILNNGYKVTPRANTLEKYKFSDSRITKVAWLKVEGTNIDYPVVYNSQNLNVGTTVYQENFVWTNENDKKITNRVFIVGHNIQNVSANPEITNKNHVEFEQLLSFVYYDFAKKNEYIQYTIGGKDYLYKIFSISFVDDVSLNYTNNSYNKSKLATYIKNSLNDSYFKYNIDVNKNDNIISLVTCTRMFGATADKTFKVDARMVRKNESTLKYQVTTKSNYKKITDIMKKGGDSNEKA